MISPARGCCRREAVFCLLFATVFLSNGLAHEGLEHDHHEHTHSCGHNMPKNKEFQEHMHEEYKVTRELTKQMRANMQISDPSTTGPARRAYSTDAAVRILADYDQLGSDTTADTIRNTIMPKAIAVMARQMSMKSPLSGNLYLPVNCIEGLRSGDTLYCTKVDSSSSDPGICSFSDLGVSHSWKYFGSYQICTGASPEACTDHAAQEGADADFIIYVASKDVSCSGSTLAYAGACKVDATTGRPLAGYVNFCPTATAEATEQSAIDTAVHEILHAMFFTDTLMETFIDTTGTALGASGAFTTDYAGRKTVKTPTVVAKAQEIFNCPSAAGIPLEDAGGGSSTSHWEMAHMYGDVMLASSSALEKIQFGPFTMAVVEDTGWYEPNWAAAGYTDYGKDAGCSFLSSSCTSFAASNSNQDFFCSASGDFQCSHDNRYMVYCSENTYYNPGCIAGAPFSTSVISNSQSNSNCFDPTQHEADARFGFYYGENSRCIDIASTTQYNLGNGFITTRDSALCAQTSCSSGVLQVTLEGTTFPCPTGSTVDLSTTVGGNFESGTITCPDNTDLCAGIGTCTNDCSGNGFCYQGSCYCFMGFVGSDCSTAICTSSSCSGTCDAASGTCSTAAASSPPPPNSSPPPPPPPLSPPPLSPPPPPPPTSFSPPPPPPTSPPPASPSPPPPTSSSPPPPPPPPPTIPPPTSPSPPPPTSPPPPPPPPQTAVQEPSPPPTSPSPPPPRSPPLTSPSPPPPRTSPSPPPPRTSPSPPPPLSSPSPPPPRSSPSPPPPLTSPSPPPPRTSPSPPPPRNSPRSSPPPPPPATRSQSPPPPISAQPVTSPFPPPLSSPPAPLSPRPAALTPTVTASITLLDFTFEGIQDKQLFVDDLIQSIADVLGVEIDMISVTELFSGSVTVKFEVAAETAEEAQMLSKEVALLPEAPQITEQFGTVEVAEVLIVLPPPSPPQPPSILDATIGGMSAAVLYGAIAGGVVVVLVLMGCLICCCCKRQGAGIAPSPPSTPQPTQQMLISSQQSPAASKTSAVKQQWLAEQQIHEEESYQIRANGRPQPTAEGMPARLAVSQRPPQVQQNYAHHRPPQEQLSVESLGSDVWSSHRPPPV